jgi:hypothetical protein
MDIIKVILYIISIAVLVFVIAFELASLVLLRLIHYSIDIENQNSAIEYNYWELEQVKNNDTYCICMPDDALIYLQK